MAQSQGSPLHFWLKLQAVPGIGPLRFSLLMEKFGSPEKAMKASIAELTSIPGISRRLAENLRSAFFLPDAPHEEEIRLAKREGVRIIGLGMPEYPELLSRIPDPPPILYVKGDLPSDAVAVAIIGSRNASRYGLENAFSIAGDLARSSLLVVSGLARGIDAAAHEGALAAGGKTIAVLGSGLGRIYPPENGKLAEKIAENGALISPFAMKTPPDAMNFPARNRIISGLSLGVAVIEAAERSGSLITARLAAEQGREVFALPGNVRSGKSTGSHRLLKEGACLVESAEDILNELQILPRSIPKNIPVEEKNSLALPETTVLKALDSYPVHIDTLAFQTGIAAGRLSAILLTLELQGMVVQHPGKHFSKA